MAGEEGRALAWMKDWRGDWAVCVRRRLLYGDLVAMGDDAIPPPRLGDVIGLIGFLEVRIEAIRLDSHQSLLNLIQ